MSTCSGRAAHPSHGSTAEETGAASPRAAKHNLHSTHSTNPAHWGFLLFLFLLLLPEPSRSSPAPSAPSSSGHIRGVFPKRQKKITSQSSPLCGIFFFLLYHLKFFFFCALFHTFERNPPSNHFTTPTSPSDKPSMEP